MEPQEVIKTPCQECQREVVVPTITDFAFTFQTAPAVCECGWEQPGKKMKCGFIADDPIGYANLRSSGDMKTAEDYIQLYGESYRRLFESALQWRNEQLPKWYEAGLEEKDPQAEQDAFITALLSWCTVDE